MIGLRIFLLLFLLGLAVYTGTVISTHGTDLAPIFFGDIQAMDWPGQFNLDFTGFLILSALWTAWRHRFSVWGLILAVLAFFGGMAFLATYLLVAARSARTIP
jgi:hypothetical protein